MKIFIDANIFVAASGNSAGGSAYLFAVAAQESSWHLITSALVLFEARLNVQKKLSDRLPDFHQFILSPVLTVIQAPPSTLVQLSQKIINQKDAPILAAAVFAQADYLCTLDQKDFHTAKVKRWCARRHLTVVTPKDLLVQWRST